MQAQDAWGLRQCMSNMYLQVQKTRLLSGQVIPPSSKSQSIRGMILALIAHGESTLMNPLDSDDMQHAMNVCKQLGATITVHKDKLVIKSTGLPIQTEAQKIYTGNSGITTRFIMPLLGLRQNSEQPIILDCGDQMRARPIHSLVNALRDLGLNIQYLDKQGALPVSISGQLKGGTTQVEGITSQYLSALLLSLPWAPLDSEITVKNLHERPYVEMTLNWLKEQNIHYTHTCMEDKDVYQIPGNQRYNSFYKVIAGDFSSASYLIAAAVLTEGSVQLTGLNMQDPQGDKRLVYILQEMGANIEITLQGLTIHGGADLKGIKIDANDIPDLLPTLAVIGTYAKGKTEMINVRQARIKETDRIHSMTEGLTRLGAKVEEYDDGLTVYQSKLQGAHVKGYDDHRTVMALALAGMLAEGSTWIDDSHAIHKTFPTFVNIMQSLGANMKVVHEANA